jgi:hypothetical protein
VPVRGTDTAQDEVVMSVRYIGGVIDRARLRTTTMYRITPEFQFGVEYNPLAGEVGPLANWRIVDESADVPALIVGTSSDRIGTPHGTSFYATLSKNLDPLIDVPLSPYVGVSYGTFDDEFFPIGGVRIDYTNVFSSTHFHDGVNLHHMVSATIDGRHSISLLLAEVDDHHHVGISYGVSFGF